MQKVGRTHLQDATFIMVDQEISAFVDGLKTAKTMLLQNADHLLDVALGGTAVGTGVNTPKGYLDVMENCITRGNRRSIPREEQQIPRTCPQRCVHDGSRGTQYVSYYTIQNR